MNVFGPYFLHFRYTGRMADYGNKNMPYNPIMLTQRALSLYDEYLLRKSEKTKKLFLECADFLTDKLVLKGNFGVWPYYHLFSRARMFGCKIPWVSALTQGLGISALVRAYSLVGHKKYLSTAELALGAFNIPMIHGGVLSIDEDDNDLWYEEYACASSRPSGVLNGFIFALLGIYDFHSIANDNSSKRLFDEGVSTLRHHLRDFDTNSPYKLTYYDRQKHVATIDYHIIHIKLMEILHKITRGEIFKTYQERWQKYTDEWFKRRGYKWLSGIYYVKSGYSSLDSAKLIIRSFFDAYLQKQRPADYEICF